MNVSEQRKDVQDTVHSLDKRVSILETRQEQQGREIRDMRTDIRETRDAVGEVHIDLREHMQQQASDRAKLMMWAIATLVGVVTSIAIPLLLRGVS